MKKFRLKINAYILMAVMLLGIFVPASNVQAATGRTTLSVSASTLNIGDTVSVTARAMAESGGSAYALMTLSYNASVLEFVSCSATYGGGAGGSVSASIDTFTVQFKAIGAGTCALSLSAADGVEFSTGEELTSMEGSSTNIVVNNAASSGGSTGGSTGGNTGGSTGGNSGGSTGGNTGSESGSGSTGGTTTPVRLSADNSLKELTISPGTLSPEFQGSRVNYTATVSNDVTNIAVNAVTSHSRATIESLTGNTNLSVGENAIKIVVKAENGTTATYTIKVTRQDASGTVAPPTEENTSPEGSDAPLDDMGNEDISYNNGVYRIVNHITSEIVPNNFTVETVNYHGTECKGMVFEHGTLTLLYVAKADLSDPTGHFVVYDETRDAVYPYIRIANGNRYVIPMLAPVDVTIPDTYTSTSFVMENGESVAAYQVLSEEEMQKDFYLFYGINQNGDEMWYQYDAAEGTYQRQPNPFAVSTVTDSEDTTADSENSNQELVEQYWNERNSFRNKWYVSIFIIVALLIAMVNIFLFYHRRNENMEDDSIEERKAIRRRTETRNQSVRSSSTSAKRAPRRTEAPKAEKKKTESKKNIEVWDFNDED